jgi:hypothetical protein
MAATINTRNITPYIGMPACNTNDHMLATGMGRYGEVAMTSRLTRVTTKTTRITDLGRVKSRNMQPRRPRVTWETVFSAVFTGGHVDVDSAEVQNTL